MMVWEERGRWDLGSDEPSPSEGVVRYVPWANRKDAEEAWPNGKGPTDYSCMYME